MTYALSAFGADAAACTPNSTRNPKSGDCICDMGFDVNTLGFCLPVDVSAPCQYTGEAHNPIDKICTCPPGYHADPGPGGTTCMRFSWFPNCVDASGKTVDNCFFGYDRHLVLTTAGAGAFAGLVLGWLLTR